MTVRLINLSESGTRLHLLTDIQTVAGEKIVHILIAAVLGLGGILFVALEFFGAIFTVLAFLSGFIVIVPLSLIWLFFLSD